MSFELKSKEQNWASKVYLLIPKPRDKNNSILSVDMCIVCVLNVQCVCNDCDINQCSWGHGATAGTIYPQVLIRQSGTHRHLYSVLHGRHHSQPAD